MEDDMSKKNDVKIIATEKMQLPVDLTPAEVADYADQCARLVDQIDTEEAAEAARKKHKKEDIDGLKSTHRGLSMKVRDRSEYRPVECDIPYDFTTGERKVVRKDTAEIVSKRALTIEERDSASQRALGE